MTTTADSEAGIQSHLGITVGSAGMPAWVERTATFDGVEGDLTFGVSPKWNDKYFVVDGQFPIRATTNDVFVASVAACMTGVFAYALEVRGILVTPETLVVDVETDMGPADDDGAWIVRSIALTFNVKVEESKRAAAERTLATYDRHCLLSQTLKGGRCELSSAITYM
ncbi:hypothetical protein BH09ACT10_BH09ACT10_10220 [soil metagenome]